jgi:hypothetical protein
VALNSNETGAYVKPFLGAFSSFTVKTAGAGKKQTFISYKTTKADNCRP